MKKPKTKIKKNTKAKPVKRAGADAQGASLG
jgi:hypothetical protein